MSDLAAIFRRPFAEQVAAYRLRLRNLVPTARWDDLRRAEHDRAFMVAGALLADLLADLAAAVDRGVTQGTTLEDFRRDFRAIVEARGWHGWTGEGTAKGEAWRTRVIYRTNMATSYAAGRMAQLVAGDFAFWVYRHGGSREPRIQHLGWNGVALPPDHPFWVDHAPPNGWGCSCYVVGARTAAGVKRVGGDPAKALPEGWQKRDPKTGAPEGIDKGWDYAPGASAATTIQALAEKALNWDYNLATAYMRDVPKPHREALSAGYRALPGVQTEMRRWVERVLGERNAAPIDAGVEVQPLRTLGLVPEAHLRQMADAGPIRPALYDYVVDASAVRHVFARHADAGVEASRGQRVVEPGDFARLAVLLNAPDAIEPAGIDRALGQTFRFSKRFGAETLVALFEVRARRRRLALVTMWVETRAGTPPT